MVKRKLDKEKVIKIIESCDTYKRNGKKKIKGVYTLIKEHERTFNLIFEISVIYEFKENIRQKYIAALFCYDDLKEIKKFKKYIDNKYEKNTINK